MPKPKSGSIRVNKNGSIRLTGALANAFFAQAAVAHQGEKALDNTTGPAREAVEQVLADKKKGDNGNV